MASPGPRAVECLVPWHLGQDIGLRWVETRIRGVNDGAGATAADGVNFLPARGDGEGVAGQSREVVIWL